MHLTPICVLCVIQWKVHLGTLGIWRGLLWWHDWILKKRFQIFTYISLQHALSDIPSWLCSPGRVDDGSCLRSGRGLYFSSWAEICCSNEVWGFLQKRDLILSRKKGSEDSSTVTEHILHWLHWFSAQDLGDWGHNFGSFYLARRSPSALMDWLRGAHWSVVTPSLFCIS